MNSRPVHLLFLPSLILLVSCGGKTVSYNSNSDLNDVSVTLPTAQYTSFSVSATDLDGKMVVTFSRYASRKFLLSLSNADLEVIFGNQRVKPETTKTAIWLSGPEINTCEFPEIKKALSAYRIPDSDILDGSLTSYYYMAPHSEVPDEFKVKLHIKNDSFAKDTTITFRKHVGEKPRSRPFG